MLRRSYLLAALILGCGKSHSAVQVDASVGPAPTATLTAVEPPTEGITAATPLDPPPDSGRVTVSRLRRLGYTCIKDADCGSPDLFCEYAEPGCHGVKGICRDTSCRTLPMNFTYCGCDGQTKYTRSNCKPAHPFAAWDECRR